MKPGIAVALIGGMLSSAVAGAVTSSRPVIYPQKGQSQEKQAKDEAECGTWATQKTGVSPEKLLEQSQQAGVAPQGKPGGGAVGGAAKGAAVGAIGGAIGGNAGTGAAIGAGVGAVGGAGRKAKEQREAQAQLQQRQEQIDSQLASYHRAQAACLEGRGYSVK